MNLVKFIGQVLLYFGKSLAYGWILAIIEITKGFIADIKRYCAWEKLPHPVRNGYADCITVSHPSYHRPDPCIYSQFWLTKLGLPVSWDNPDIDLLRNGVIVNKHDLLPSTEYEMRARIWNNSYDAPVIGMQVEFSYLSFGVGTTSTPIGSRLVDVGVKGGPNHPATASIPWITPPVPGHYCLQVKLDWIDDANQDNNLGQSNTDVVAAQSPAHFSFQLRNAFAIPRNYTFTIDTYAMLPVPDCGTVTISKESRSARIRDVVARYRAMNFGVPAGWAVAISPDTILLAPGDEQTIQVEVTPPAGFTGQLPFNVNAFADGWFAGGVTLTVTKA
jgi:hypothetical protein